MILPVNFKVKGIIFSSAKTKALQKLKGFGPEEEKPRVCQHPRFELVAMTDCGDCPGLVVPRVKILSELTKNLERPLEVLHLGTCMKLAMETAGCPIVFEDLRETLTQKFGVKVVLGTHSY
ncbi:MAG: CGGC domain-containing protein [Desulfuromonadaceae bacterium]